MTTAPPRRRSRHRTPAAERAAAYRDRRKSDDVQLTIRCSRRVLPALVARGDVDAGEAANRRILEIVLGEIVEKDLGIVDE